MTQDPKDIPIEELELSVRTDGFLANLDVATLGDLLALAEISGPPLVLAELQELFAELGLEYSGRFVPAKVEVIQATGEVAERWNTIEDWLDQNFPEAVDGFEPAATEDQIRAAEEALGVVLPEDYRAFLGIHNGQKSAEPMVATCSLLPVEKLVETRLRLLDLHDEPDRPVSGKVHPAIQAVEMSPAWIPVGVSARGRDFLCLDLDPTDAGNPGQVILIAVDFDDRELVAPSFCEFLSVYFRQAQTGEIEMEW